MKQPRSNWSQDTWRTHVPTMEVHEADEENWTGLLDQFGNRIMYRRQPVGFTDFELLRKNSQN